MSATENSCCELVDPGGACAPVCSESDVVKAWKDAEIAIKTVESHCSDMDLPSVNELRYAGTHLNRYLANHSHVDELWKAKRHCLRARFDAYDFACNTYFERFKNFSDQNMPNMDIVRKHCNEYFERMREVRKIRDKLGALAISGKREEGDAEVLEMLGRLREIWEFVFEANPAILAECRKIDKENRTKYIILIISLAGVLFACGNFVINLINTQVLHK